MADASGTSYIGGELDLFALAKNWKSYVKREIADYITGDVLEVGAGIGTTTLALNDGAARRWICLEPDAVLAARLQSRLDRCAVPSTTSVIVGSLNTFADHPCFDCILYIDVLEHIEDDHMQIESASRLVRPGGHIVILSPAHQWLFSKFDESIGHLRRYDKSHLKSMMPNGWLEKKLAYLDSMGVFLSLGNVLALRQAMPTQAQILTWDRVCIPVSRFVDRFLLGTIGKSVLAVWCKR